MWVEVNEIKSINKWTNDTIITSAYIDEISIKKKKKY